MHKKTFQVEAEAGSSIEHKPPYPVDRSYSHQQRQHASRSGKLAVHPAITALQSRRFGVTFAGAGFGAAYQLGAAHMLGSLHILSPHTPVAGTSAGGFVAAATRCAIPYLYVLEALQTASKDLLEHGQNKRIRSTLKPHLERLLPLDAHKRCNSGGPFCLAATRVKGPCPVCWKPTVMSDRFDSKEDLVQRLLVSAHEPKVSDGCFCIRYNGHYYFDGGVRKPVPEIPGADYTVIIYPMPNKLLTRTWPYKLLLHPPPPSAIAISPGEYRHWPYSNSYQDSQRLVMHPQPPEVLNMLFERGRRDALCWAQHIGLTAAFIPALPGSMPQLPSIQVGKAVGQQTPPAGLAPAGYVDSAHASEISSTGNEVTQQSGRDQEQYGAVGGGSRSSGGIAASGVDNPERQRAAAAAGTGHEASELEELLATPADELQLIVPVPENLRHML